MTATEHRLANGLRALPTLGLLVLIVGATGLGLIGPITALVILLSLGTWQVERLQWKEALIADIESRSTAAPYFPVAGS